jgi:hypothetical protein
LVSDKEESHNNDDDDIITDIQKSVKDVIPKVNILGTDIKLDSLSILGLVLGGAAVLGTGYVLYNQFKEKGDQQKALEEQKKQQEVYQRYWYDAYNRQLQDQQHQQQQAKAMAATAAQVKEQEEQEGDKGDQLIDMSEYADREPPKVEYSPDEALRRANMYGQLPHYNESQSQQQSTHATQDDSNYLITDVDNPVMPVNAPKKQISPYDPMGTNDNIYY